MNDSTRPQVRTNDDPKEYTDVGKTAEGGVPLPTSLEASDAYGSGNSLGISCAGYSLQSNFEAITDWVESVGADNLAVNTDHRGVGENSLEFDKIAGNVLAMISKEIDSFDLSAYSSHAIGHMYTYLSDLTNVDYVLVRMGTDSSNYWEWQFSADIMEDGWNDLDTAITSPTSQTGDGCNLSAITWMAFGVVFDAVGNTLNDIRTSGWSVKRVLETTQIITSDIQVNTPFLGIKDRNSNTRLDVANGASYNYLYNRHTDGTNLMPTGDSDARALYVNLGANNDVTVTGTVTADLGATDNAVLDNIELYNQGSEAALEKIDGAIIGDGEPDVDSYGHIAINLSTGANQLLVSSAASKQIWVYGVGFTTNVSGTVSFQDEDDTAISGIMHIAENSGLLVNPSGNFSMPIWKLATNKDLEVDIVSCEVDGWLSYAIVSV